MGRPGWAGWKSQKNDRNWATAGLLLPPNFQAGRPDSPDSSLSSSDISEEEEEEEKAQENLAAAVTARQAKAGQGRAGGRAGVIHSFLEAGGK